MKSSNFPHQKVKMPDKILKKFLVCESFTRRMWFMAHLRFKSCCITPSLQIQKIHVQFLTNFEFISYFGLDSKLERDLLNEFPAMTLATVRRWFGVSEFVLVQGPKGKEVGVNETSMLMSSILLALNHAALNLPIFVRETKKGTYVGCWKTLEGKIIKFESDVTNQVHESFMSISGMVDYFLVKLVGVCSLGSWTKMDGFFVGRKMLC